MSEEDERSPSGGVGEGDQRPRYGALLALGIIAVLIVAAVLITHRLHRDAALQDCVAAGRTNCAPIGQSAQ